MTNKMRNIFSLLILHAYDIQNSAYDTYYPRWQKITEEEMNKYKTDYDRLWSGKLKLRKYKSTQACLGILNRNMHYKLLDLIFFKVLDSLMEPFDPTSINVTDLEATITFENQKIVMQAVKFFQDLSPNMIINVKAHWKITLQLGKIPADKNKQVIFI